jgi:NTP pyrophosphatase (non-canonical NTP hydrolase)
MSEDKSVPEMTNEMEARIYEALKRRYGSFQIIVAIEELAELQQALTKYLRNLHVDGTGNLNDIREHIREEIADVNIMVNQMEMMFGDTGDIQEAKLQRLYGLVEDLFDEDGNLKPMHWWGGGEE